MIDAAKDLNYPFIDPNRRIILEFFPDLFTSQQLDELCDYIYLNGMIPHSTLDEMSYIEKGDTCLIIQRSPDNRLVIHKGILTDQLTDTNKEDSYDILWEITDKDNWQSYIWESDLSQCIVFKCTYTW